MATNSATSATAIAGDGMRMNRFIQNLSVVFPCRLLVRGEARKRFSVSSDLAPAPTPAGSGGYGALDVVHDLLDR